MYLTTFSVKKSFLTIFHRWLTMKNHGQNLPAYSSEKILSIDTHIDLFTLTFFFNRNLTAVTGHRPRSICGHTKEKKISYHLVLIRSL